MPITFKDRETIASDLVSRILPRTSELTAVESGDPLRHLLEDGVASANSDLYRKAAEVLQGGALSEATRDSLDRLGRDQGVNRDEATRATVTLRFEASAAPTAYIDIAQGTEYWRSGTDGNPVKYRTTQTPATLLTASVATGGGANYIENTGAAWTPEAFNKGMVNIRSGTGALQARQVDYNTPTRIYVTANWTVNPAAGSTIDVTTGRIPLGATDVFTDGTPKPGGFIPSEASEAGSQGNAETNVIVYGASLPTPLIAVTNPLTAYGGTDKENDIAYYRRILAKRSLDCGVAEDGIKARVLQYVDGSGNRVLRSCGAVVVSSSVDLYIDDGSGAPNALLVADVQRFVDGKWTDPTMYGAGAAGITRTVHAATMKRLRLTATITMNEGISPAAVQSAARQSMWNFVNVQMGVGEAFYPRKLLGALNSPSYTDVDLTISYESGGSFVTVAAGDYSPITAAAYERFWCDRDPEVKVI
ncbi:MAG: baseplate J/gp47 family protein [Patescibacteria group bacterium]